MCIVFIKKLHQYEETSAELALGFNWRYDIDLIYGGFTVLGGTENKF